jgi:protoheme IX farnesyltransferase
VQVRKRLHTNAAERRPGREPATVGVCLSLLAPPGSRRNPARRVVPLGDSPAGAVGDGNEQTPPAVDVASPAPAPTTITLPITFRHRIGAYIALTKPRIIELLLVTTVPAMILAKRGMPGGWLVLATLVGGSLAAGSANTINCYVDRDIDQVMHRTRSRPLALHQVAPRSALIFGVILGVLATLELGFTTNWLSAWLADGAIAFYVFVYTLGLKRRTSANIVIGGAAGCFPVLIGWSTVTGTVGWSAVLLFLIVFLWTPPHFWALAMRFRDDYAAAGVPMLPVVATARAVGLRIVGYSWLMVVASLALLPVAHLGLIYLVSAVVSGGAFILEAHALLARTLAGRDPRPMRLFHFSITYLTVLFVAIALDQLI